MRTPQEPSIEALLTFGFGYRRKEERHRDEFFEDETDDLYLQKFAVIITACADGKVRMYRAER